MVAVILISNKLNINKNRSAYSVNIEYADLFLGEGFLKLSNYFRSEILIELDNWLVWLTADNVKP